MKEQKGKADIVLHGHAFRRFKERLNVHEEVKLEEILEKLREKAFVGKKAGKPPKGPFMNFPKMGGSFPLAEDREFPGLYFAKTFTTKPCRILFKGRDTEVSWYASKEDYLQAHGIPLEISVIDPPYMARKI